MDHSQSPDMPHETFKEEGNEQSIQNDPTINAADQNSQTFSSLEDNIESQEDEIADDELSESDLREFVQEESLEQASSAPKEKQRVKKRRAKRKNKDEVAEVRLKGRRSLCKKISDIAPHMLKTVKLRILSNYLDSTKNLSDGDLTNYLIKDSKKLASKERILKILNTVDPDVNRRNLKSIILFAVLLQEETHSLEEQRLDEKVVEFEKNIVKLSKDLDYFDANKHESMRWHHYDTYRIVLEAAWRNRDDISHDEAALLAVLRKHLNISMEEHWTIGAFIKRFPKEKCVLHSPDDIHEARKQLQKEGLLWNYRDENDRKIDVIPYEVVKVLVSEIAKQELQRTNYRRLLENDAITVPNLKKVLQVRNMDRHGAKSELIKRIFESDILPSEVLEDLESSKLADMCRLVALKSSGTKSDRIERLIDFYDDLTFEERTTKDEREEWYNNYELLASRSYSDLKAKKIITKDLHIEHLFEKATNFLFDVKLNVTVDHKRKGTNADGRILLEGGQTLLWDCKSAENMVNLQDHLESQFDGYLRKQSATASPPLAFIVIAPHFTPQSVKLAHQYKARTNWDIALVTAGALKYLAELWSASSPGKPFPIRLLNKTELIDRAKAEYLHSLA